MTCFPPDSADYLVPNGDGQCVCPDNAALSLGGRCVPPLALIPIALVLALLFAAFSPRSLRTVEGDKAVMQAEVASLRSMLHLRWADGFVLSSEWRPVWLFLAVRQAVTIDARHMEAAARLSLLRDDFDPKGLDLLCLVLQECPTQRQRLRRWIVDLCAALLDPDDFGNNAALSLTHPPRRTNLMEHRMFLPSAVLPSDDDSEGIAGWSPERRFRYFRCKMCGLLLFQQDGRSLLEELKRVAQALMDGLASRYESRYAQLCSSDRGLELAALQLITIPSGVGNHPILRQDDVQVLTETKYF